jgi:hypothetical protein
LQPHHKFNSTRHLVGDWSQISSQSSVHISRMSECRFRKAHYHHYDSFSRYACHRQHQNALGLVNCGLRLSVTHFLVVLAPRWGFLSASEGGFATAGSPERNVEANQPLRRQRQPLRSAEATSNVDFKAPLPVTAFRRRQIPDIYQRNNRPILSISLAQFLSLLLFTSSSHQRLLHTRACSLWLFTTSRLLNPNS